jgi:hypothetical protein
LIEGVFFGGRRMKKRKEKTKSVMWKCGNTGLCHPAKTTRLD